jgi:hypothetical protein
MLMLISSLGRAGVVGQYSTSSAVNDIILRSGNKLILQSGTGAAGVVIDTANNVFIGASTNSSDDGNVNIAIPDSTFYVRGPRTIGSTTNISFRGGLEGNANGKVRIWLSSDAAHSSYIESHHTGSGFTTLSFGTSGGNALPTERMIIKNIGNVGIGKNPSWKLDVDGNVFAGNNSFLLSSYNGIGGSQYFGKEYLGGIIAGMEIENTTFNSAGNQWLQKLHFHTHVFGGGYGRRMTIHEVGNVSMVSSLSLGGALTLPADTVAIYSGGNRNYFINNGPTIYWGYGDPIHQFRNPSNNNVFTIASNGTLSFQNYTWHQCLNGNARFYFAPNSTTYIRGHASGGGSPIEFRNASDTPIAWFNGDGELTCMFETQSQTDSDHIIIRGNTGLSARGRYKMLIGHNSFTGFHRCYYEDDELFNNDMVKK